MADELKGSSLSVGGSSPDMPENDFSKMSDEDLMNMDISDIFLEDLDSFLAEKEFRASKRERMETVAEHLNAGTDKDLQTKSAVEAVGAGEAPVGAAEAAAAQSGTAAGPLVTGAAASAEEAAAIAESKGASKAEALPAAEENAADVTNVELPEAGAEISENVDEPEAKAEAEGLNAARETAEGVSKESVSETGAEASESTPEAVAAAETADEPKASESTPEAVAAAETADEPKASESTPEAVAAAETADEPKDSETSENIPEGAAAAGSSDAGADPAVPDGQSAEPVQAAPPVIPAPVVPPVQPVSPSQPPSEPPAEPKKKPGIAGLIFVGALLCCAVIAIAAAYFYYADYFEKRFYPGTIINDRDVSVMEPSVVKQDIANEIVTYRLDIKELNDVTETITSEDIGLAYVDDGAVDDILKSQDTKTWFLQIFGTKSYEVSAGTTYDREKAEQVVNGLACLAPENITSPQDAQLVDNGTSFSIQPEVEGNELDTEKFKQMVFAALDASETEIDIVADDCYLHPTIRSDDENLNTRMNEYNAILGVNVYYVFGENTEYVNADVLRQYITDDGNHVTLSDDYARKIVYGWGQKYDTFGLAREFQTHSGEYIMLPAGGDYGWVINKDVTIADVQDAVTTQAAGERTPTFLYSAMGWDNGDITGTYVEVSISEQKLWCYHNYELVMETDVVTGLPTTERETRAGIYAIDAKKEDAVLGTEDVQGYSSPVSFWAPFDGGRGLHDAPWRGSFGGNIYQYDGSHGCVNIPPENMETIFNAIEIGNAVIVY